MTNQPTDRHPHLLLVKSYLRALERGVDDAELAEYFGPQVEQREFPNRLVERGAVRDLDQLRQGNRKGKLVVEDQRYSVHNALVAGAHVAVELTWTARLKLPLGSLKPGDTMTAHCGFFFRIEDGKIATQHNYDCFEPF
jgi:ketosteroid isomerase-like protein